MSAGVSGEAPKASALSFFGADETCGLQAAGLLLVRGTAGLGRAQGGGGGAGAPRERDVAQLAAELVLEPARPRPAWPRSRRPRASCR